MTKEHLTDQTLMEIARVSDGIRGINEILPYIQKPITESDFNNFRFSPLRQFEDTISRYGITDLFEVYRLLLVARLQKKQQELEAQLLETVNAK